MCQQKWDCPLSVAGLGMSPSYALRPSPIPHLLPAKSAKSLQFATLAADCKNTMWCKHCRQDVPAQSSADNRDYRCPRCGEAICRDTHHACGGPAIDPAKSDSTGDGPSFRDCPNFRVSENGTVPLAAERKGTVPGFHGDRGESVVGENGAVSLGDTSTGSQQPTFYDGWAADEQLRHIGRALQTGNAASSDAEPIDWCEISRVDLPQADAPAWHISANRQSQERRKAARDDRGSTPGVVTWLALSLGTTSFVCGGVLLGWSLVTGRQELWTVGLPVALVGQISLLIGLVLQLDRLWRDNRAAAAKLDNVDEQLHDLKTTTTLLGATQGAAGARFYSHFAGGAGPQLLLADLKSQLDLLAMKISQENR